MNTPIHNDKSFLEQNYTLESSSLNLQSIENCERPSVITTSHLLEYKLQRRSSRDRLAKKNIIKFPNVAPSLIHQTEKLVWERRRCELQNLISNRPSRDFLVQKKIIKDVSCDESTKYEVAEKIDKFLKTRPMVDKLVKLHILDTLDPYVGSIARKLDQERLKGSLLDALSHRPTPSEMKQRGLLVEED